MEPKSENKKPIDKILSIKGTRANLQSGQLLVSSGIPSLDELLGGGLPVGSIVLLEEDKNGIYARTILKYFLAEGVVHKHSIFLASQDYNPNYLIKDLPAVISSDPEPDTEDTKKKSDKMTIAFRYQRLSTSQKQIKHHFGNYYDLSKNMPEEKFENVNITTWSAEGSSSGEIRTKFSNPKYFNLLTSIQQNIEKGNFFVQSESKEERSILRLGLQSLGSPLWFSQKRFSEESSSSDLNLFMFYLRALLRSSLAVALITVPSHLYSMSFMSRLYNLSDVVMRLESFAGTPLERNQVLSDFHGYFVLKKMAPINTFVSKHPGSIEYVFKLRRKKFCIEVLHLPPDLSNAEDDSGSPKMGCGIGGNSALDF